MDPEKTQGAPLLLLLLSLFLTFSALVANPKKETQEALSDSEEKTRDVAEPASTDLGGPVVPARLKLAIGGNIPPTNIIAHVESADARRCGRGSVVMFSAGDRITRRVRRREECVGVRRRGLDSVAAEGGDTGSDSRGRVTGTENRQQTTDSLKRDEW